MQPYSRGSSPAEFTLRVVCEISDPCDLEVGQIPAEVTIEGRLCRVDSAAIFTKDFSGHPARKISKNDAAAYAFGCPSRPATLATSLCDVAAQ
jgi:hypothetical protein